MPVPTWRALARSCACPLARSCDFPLALWPPHAGARPGPGRVQVPEIFREYLSPEVIVMEYVPGVKINNGTAIDEMGLDRQRLARLSVESYLQQLLRHGLFHADPHPGNVAVDAENGGRLIYYDFGMMGRIQPRVRCAFSALCSAFPAAGAAVPCCSVGGPLLCSAARLVCQLLLWFACHWQCLHACAMASTLPTFPSTPHGSRQHERCAARACEASSTACIRRTRTSASMRWRPWACSSAATAPPSSAPPSSSSRALRSGWRSSAPSARPTRRARKSSRRSGRRRTRRRSARRCGPRLPGLQAACGHVRWACSLRCAVAGTNVRGPAQRSLPCVQILANIGEDLLIASADKPFRFPAEFTFVVRSFTVLDGIGKSLSPRFDISEISAPYARELILDGKSAAQQFQDKVERGLKVQDRAVKGLFTGPIKIEEIQESVRRCASRSRCAAPRSCCAALSLCCTAPHWCCAAPSVLRSPVLLLRGPALVLRGPAPVLRGPRPGGRSGAASSAAALARRAVRTGALRGV